MLFKKHEAERTGKRAEAALRGLPARPLTLHCPRSEPRPCALAQTLSSKSTQLSWKGHSGRGDTYSYISFTLKTNNTITLQTPASPTA